MESVGSEREPETREEKLMLSDSFSMSWGDEVSIFLVMIVNPKERDLK